MNVVCKTLLWQLVVGPIITDSFCTQNPYSWSHTHIHTWHILRKKKYKNFFLSIDAGTPYLVLDVVVTCTIWSPCLPAEAAEKDSWIVSPGNEGTGLVKILQTISHHLALLRRQIDCFISWCRRTSRPGQERLGPNQSWCDRNQRRLRTWI